MPFALHWSGSSRQSSPDPSVPHGPRQNARNAAESGGGAQNRRGVLEDLVESGLVYRAGRGSHASFRAASPADLEYVKGHGAESDGADTLVWGSVYRVGPVTRDVLAKHVALPSGELDASLERLVDAGRVTRTEVDGVATLRADTFVVPLGGSLGWEAAVVDHFQALVTTVLAKLRRDAGAGPDDLIGGSTYTLEVWEGHPLEEEALGQLRVFRARVSDLRSRIAAHNAVTESTPGGCCWCPEITTKLVLANDRCVVLEGAPKPDGCAPTPAGICGSLGCPAQCPNPTLLKCDQGVCTGS